MGGIIAAFYLTLPKTDDDEMDELDRIAAASSLMAVHMKASKQCRQQPDIEFLLSLPEFTNLISLERQALAKSGKDNLNERMLMLNKVTNVVCQSTPNKT